MYCNSNAFVFSNDVSAFSLARALLLYRFATEPSVHCGTLSLRRVEDDSGTAFDHRTGTSRRWRLVMAGWSPGSWSGLAALWSGGRYVNLRLARSQINLVSVSRAMAISSALITVSTFFNRCLSSLCMASPLPFIRKPYAWPAETDGGNYRTLR